MNDTTTAAGVILIADDNPEARRMLDVRLKREGHHTVLVENGRQALDALAREPVDVVLLDIDMPELNGYGVLAAVKADPRLAHLPVLVISGGGDQEDLVRCIEMGAVDFLPKPFNQAVLRARVGSCLRQKRERDRERRAAAPAVEAPPAAEGGDTHTWQMRAPQPHTPVADAPPPPARLGRIVVGRLLGSGGMGQVYLGHHELLDLPVAVKLVRPELTVRPEARDRVLREARLAARLGHRHVVRLLEVGETDECVYLAFEFVGGGTLADLLDREPARRLPVERAVRVAQQVALALAEADALGITHRDIKPANLLLTADGEVMVADFGLARQSAGGAPLASDAALAGTPLYMSPEQIVLGARVDVRGDLYALGCVLYEMLVGHAPFAPAATGDAPGANPTVIFRHLEHTAPLPPTGLRADVPAWLEAVCLKLLAKRPDDRFATAEALLAALAAGAPGR